MYLKVGSDNPTLIEVPADTLEYGTRVVTTPPWEVDWDDELGVAFTFVSYRGDRVPAFQVPPDMPDGVAPEPFWVVHWAWWAPYDSGIRGLVTTHPLYILNENGKTIDSVR